MKGGLFFLCILLSGLELSAQNRICKKLAPTADTITLDSGIILASSIAEDLGIFIAPNMFLLATKYNNADSVTICFRVISKDKIKLLYQNRSELENSQNPEKPKLIFPDLKPIVEENNIFTNGSISRGISSGNNQGLLIQSDLNLQMQGDLGRGVRLTAAVSDNNSPLQPDGTTLQVQDFDRVFIKIDKDSWFAVAGDYFMRQQEGNYFLQFNKKSRGLQYEAKIKSNYFSELGVQTHAAISRGRFARNEIQGREGIQGPYRLTGSQNEAFIIVIAATEVVYLDGKKLERGAQNDYVINYNASEIVFNPNVLITQYSRIIVEFQYADQNYSRVLFNQAIAAKRNKWSYRVNYFIEQDNKNQPFQAESSLSLFDSVNNINARSVLANAGDNNQLATISTIRDDQFSNARILYQKIDSMGFTDILLFTNSEALNLFSATFSNVGNNNGNYIQINANANGRVYAWVAPIAGVPQGNFEPIIQLIAPKRQQMATAAIGYRVNDNLSIDGELALSQLDENTFSALDKADDNAIGLFLKMNQSRDLGSNTMLSNQLKWERVSSGFSYIERYRGVEFERKWNRSLLNPKQDIIDQTQSIIEFNGAIASKKGQRNKLGYGLSSYQIGNSFLGINPNLNISKQFYKKLTLSLDGDYLQSNLLDSLNTKALNLNADLAWQINKSSSITLFGESAQNQIIASATNLMNANAFAYQIGGVRLNAIFNKGWSWAGAVSLRTDKLPNGSNYNWSSDGYIINNEVKKVMGNKRFALISNLRFLDQNLQFFSAKKEQFLQQRIEYADHNNKRGYRTDFYIQSGTGREQKREFLYLEVPAGQGQYAWIDYNNNGVKELNEFEVSVFADQAKYIKLFNLTNDFVNANLHEANFSLKLMPSAWFKKQNFWKNISNQTNINILQRNNSTQLWLLNPLQSDTAVLSANNLIRNTLIYNSTKLGVELTAKNVAIKQLLTFGSEEQIKTEYLIKTRYNFLNNWQIDASNSYDQRDLKNAFFENRNYQWQDNKTNVSGSWQNLKMRVSAGFAYTQGQGTEGANQALEQKTTTLNGILFYNLNVNTNLDVQVSQVNVTFNGQSNSPLGFQILNGLVQGQNFLWNFNLRTLVSKNIQLSIGYEGRKLPEINTIHIGRVEARYLF